MVEDSHFLLLLVHAHRQHNLQEVDGHIVYLPFPKLADVDYYMIHRNFDIAMLDIDLEKSPRNGIAQPAMVLLVVKVLPVESRMEKNY